MTERNDKNKDKKQRNKNNFKKSIDSINKIKRWCF